VAAPQLLRSEDLVTAKLISRDHPVRSSVGWLLLALYVAWSFGGQQVLAGVLDLFSRNLVEQALLTGLFLAVALALYRPGEVLAFAAICMVISNLFENASVMTGCPFGWFEHSPATGPRLFNIPLLATPTYLALCFIAWVVAWVITARLSTAPRPDATIAAAVIAAFVFTMWDLSNDAVFHGVNRAFTYRHPGA